MVNISNGLSVNKFAELTTSRTNDKIGRKRSIQLGASIALWGCAMQAGANSFATMLIGRIVAGFAIGCVCAFR